MSSGIKAADIMPKGELVLADGSGNYIFVDNRFSNQIAEETINAMKSWG